MEHRTTGKALVINSSGYGHPPPATSLSVKVHDQACIIDTRCWSFRLGQLTRSSDIMDYIPVYSFIYSPHLHRPWDTRRTFVRQDHRVLPASLGYIRHMCGFLTPACSSDEPPRDRFPAPTFEGGGETVWSGLSWFIWRSLCVVRVWLPDCCWGFSAWDSIIVSLLFFRWSLNWIPASFKPSPLKNRGISSAHIIDM